MAVMGLRMYVAVIVGRKRLDFEIEIVEIVVVGDVRDRLISDPVKHGEGRVEDDKDKHRARDERWPRRRHGAMADIGPKTEIKPLSDDFAVAKPDDTRLR